MVKSDGVEVEMMKWVDPALYVTLCLTGSNLCADELRPDSFELALPRATTHSVSPLASIHPLTSTYTLDIDINRII